MRKHIKKIWFILQSIILIFILIDLLLLDNEEALMKLVAFELLFSSFLGFIGILLNNILLDFVNISISETNIIYIIFNWILSVLLGYIQWFIIVPKVYLKLWSKKEMYNISVNKYLGLFGIIFIALYIFIISI